MQRAEEEPKSKKKLGVGKDSCPIAVYRSPLSSMKRIASLLLAVLGCAVTAHAQLSVTYEGKDGPGKGKHIVLLAGDEEYRSEEGLPMLGKLLSQRHGFTCTVLFSVDKDGVIDPNSNGSITDPEKMDQADAIIMLLRFRHWSDDAVKHLEAAVNRGVPIIGLRTATHAFDLGGKDTPDSVYKKWMWNNKEGGFGRIVLGETWVNHWGSHKKEANLAVIEPSAKGDPVLNGVSDIFVTTDVYEAHPVDDAKVLLRGTVLKGMNPTDEPATYTKKAKGGAEQPVNDPKMAVAWTREYKDEAGKTNKILCTTMGAASDLVDESLRRLIVNGIYWGLGMEVPAKADVTLPEGYNPTMYGFKGFKPGVKPADLQ